MDNAFDAFCKGIGPKHVAHKQLCQQNTNFTSVMKTITSKSGKTYTVPVIRMPAGTILYSGNTWETGFKAEGNSLADSGMWFSWTESIARGYQKWEPTTNLISPRRYKALRDLDLLDLWTPAAWESVFAEIGIDDNDLGEFSGIGRTTDDKRRTFVPASKATGLFPGSECKDSECSTMEWRGLLWGPNKNNYKRNSRDAYDNGTVVKIYAAFPGGIDGIFALPTPSDAHNHPSFTNPILYRVFHEEINIRPPFTEKLALVPKAVPAPPPEPEPVPDSKTKSVWDGYIYGGKRTRRRHKKSTRTRLSKKK